MAARIISEARAAGVTITITDAGKIRLTPKDRVTAELTDRVKTRKEELLSLLSARLEDFTAFRDILDRHPQLWSGLRRHGWKTLDRDHFRLLDGAGYRDMDPVPVPDVPRNGRVKCRECLHVDGCTSPARRKHGLELLHHCDDAEAQTQESEA